MTVAIAKWTLAEYHRMIEMGLLAGKRVELIRGEIVEMAPEGEPHAYFSTESGHYLARLLGERATVRPAKPITLPNQSEPEPDVAIVKPLGREYLEHHPYPEDIFWLIEYSEATLAKDLNIKSSVYAEVNIPEYWVVDLNHRSLIVFREPQAGQYTARDSYIGGELTPLAFPDVSIQVSSIVSKI
ncbi:MAG: Uma2 family endonuclease [Phormidesmis sp.]